jgi:formamidopyrimidine-DNA glycosylase
MPELPEVETVRRSIVQPLSQQTIEKVVVRQHRLRWEIPANLPKLLKDKIILDVQRRGKYLLLSIGDGTLIIHLGMSGFLRLLHHAPPPDKHDHVDFYLKNGLCLRYNDPRRFGSILWTTDITQHPLLRSLGVEPLTHQLNGEYLYQQSRQRKVSIKSFIMNSHIVVGIGNIYANEALFLAKILPTRCVNDIELSSYEALCASIKLVLKQALRAGGTTLKDFVDSNGKPGYFSQALKVYGRENEPCVQCGLPIKKIVQSQRSTFYCNNCQH